MVDLILFSFTIAAWVFGVYCGTTYGGIREIAKKAIAAINAMF